MNKVNKISKSRKFLPVLLVMIFLTAMIPQEANAGKHKDKYGHSWVSCMWKNTKIVIGGYTIKDNLDAYTH